MSGILFDARWLRPGMTGVGYFANHILAELPASAGKVGIILPRNSPFAKSFPSFRVIETRIDLTAHPLTELFEQICIPLWCYLRGYSSFVSFEGRVPALHPGIKTFSFIYDLTALKIKGSHNRKYSAFLRMSLLISRLTATRLVTISLTVQSEMSSTLGIPKKKIIVIYPASSRLATQMSAPMEKMKKPFFLSVGVTNLRKNLPNLLKAFALFNASGKYELALTGNADMIRNAVGDGGLSDVVNLGFVTEGNLRFLFENAVGLVFPSFDEGFGIPLVDAVEFKCPVICSDIAVFREVMEECAHYFNPHSPESIAQALQASQAHPNGFETRRILEKYGWKKSAAQLLEEIANC